MQDDLISVVDAAKKFGMYKQSLFKICNIANLLFCHMF
jgi:hypothetical protein